MLSAVCRVLAVLAGDHTEGETPDPIPNSEVKPLRADGTYPARDWESRSSPALFFLLDGSRLVSSSE